MIRSGRIRDLRPGRCRECIVGGMPSLIDIWRITIQDVSLNETMSVLGGNGDERSDTVDACVRGSVLYLDGARSVRGVTVSTVCPSPNRPLAQADSLDLAPHGCVLDDVEKRLLGRKASRVRVQQREG